MVRPERKISPAGCATSPASASTGPVLLPFDHGPSLGRLHLNALGTELVLARRTDFFFQFSLFVNAFLRFGNGRFPFNKARELQNLDEEDQYDEQKRNIGSFQSEVLYLSPSCPLSPS